MAKALVRATSVRAVPSRPTSTGVLPEAGLPVDIADGPNPLFHAIEFTQFSPERSEDRKPGPASRLIVLIECQISTDDALNDRRGSVEGPVPCDVREACMNLDEFVVAGRNNRRGKVKPGSSRDLDLADRDVPIRFGTARRNEVTDPHWRLRQGVRRNVARVDSRRLRQIAIGREESRRLPPLTGGATSSPAGLRGVDSPQAARHERRRGCRTI